MTLRKELTQHTGLTLDNGVFFQVDLPRSGDFEQIYLSLRKKENRLYSDEIVRHLPHLAPDKALEHEWLIRSASMNKMIAYLKKKGTHKRILEVGCGNGWFANKLASNLRVDVMALDINEVELRQGARVFSPRNLSFVYGDIFTINLPVKFDFIILASSVQYFPNIQSLIKRLLELIVPEGEIHIIDSPIYPSEEALSGAKKRSVAHFTELGYPKMAEYYFHHTMEDIGIFNIKVLENPEAIIPKIKRKLFSKNQTVFPWIVIKGQ